MIGLLASIVLLVPPTLEHRWFYLQTNLLVPANADQAIGLLERAKKAGYNGVVITDSKFSRLASMPPQYFANAKRVKDKSAELKMEVVPAVMSTGWADGLLSHDPNLIEAMPVRQASFIVREGAAVPDDPAAIANSDLRQWQVDKALGFSYQDGVGTSSFADRQVTRGGLPSVRFERFREGNEAGNGRLITSAVVRPWNQYRLTAWFKCENLKMDDSVKLMAIGADDKTLSYFGTGVRGTQDWRKVSIVFNSEDNATANLYAGVWGGRSGKLWISGLKLEAAGLLNVVRRPGAPVKVASADGIVYEEGRDFERIRDEKLGTTPWAGAYTFDHVPPPIRLAKDSRIKDGQALLVSYYHAVATDEGKAAICLSEPKTWDILRDESSRVAALWQPKTMLAAHDENRVAGWCKACTDRGKTPGQMMAEDQKKCAAIVRNATRGKTVAVWSDMFDPSHNAVPNYYLSNGSWAGSWAGLDRETLVINWASFAADRSLPFFDKLGTKQVLAGFYDGPVGSIRDWLAKASPYKKVRGVMYTTWASDYSKLEAFAEAAWGATPIMPANAKRS